MLRNDQNEATEALSSVFTSEEYGRAMGLAHPRAVEAALRVRVGRGALVRLRRGLYARVPEGMAPQDVRPEPYLVASKLAGDAVVSHHAALQLHGYAYSVWNRLTFTTRRHVRAFEHGGVEYVAVKPSAGMPSEGEARRVVEVTVDGGVVTASSLERAMVEVLHTPALGGGWEELWRSLGSVELFDLEAVVELTEAMGTALTTARVGVFLAQHRERLFVEDAVLDALAERAPRQARYLDGSREPGRLMKPWNLIVPERVLEQRWEEVV